MFLSKADVPRTSGKCQERPFVHSTGPSGSARGQCPEMEKRRVLCHRSSHLRCRAGANGCHIALAALLEENWWPGLVAEALMVPRQTTPFKSGLLPKAPVRSQPC